MCMRPSEQPSPERNPSALPVYIPLAFVLAITGWGLKNAVRDLLEGKAPKSVPVATYTPSNERERGAAK